MKLQCSCGAKYAFDATPEMLQNPVKFICPSCGLDASAFVNDLIRQEFAGQIPAPPPPPPAPAAPVSRLKISHEAAPVAAPAPEAAASSKFCAKHRERATEQCAVCHKPICPKCMEMFGYFCSPLCKGKAEAQNIDVPVFAGRKDVVEAQFWRHTGKIVGALVALVVLFFGLWVWYAWFGSVPHTYLSVRFDDTDRGYFGNAQLVGKDKDQIVFLHGGTLARYDLKTKKPVWTQELISKDQIAATVKAAYEEDARNNDGNGYKTHRNSDDIERAARQNLQEALTLHVSGQDVWVSDGEKLTHYDWDSGKPVKTVALPEDGADLVQAGDELQMIGVQSVTHINLATGDAHVDQFGPAGATKVKFSQAGAGAGLPGAGANSDNGNGLDPQKVEAQAQNLNIQGRIALPAVLSNERYEKQIENELNADEQHPRKAKSPPPDAEYFTLVPGEGGFVEFAFRMLEEHIVTRSAMKAPPKKSVIDGNLNVTQTDAAANEILNDMQRNDGRDTVTEDQSRYEVTVHQPGDASVADWTGNVVGPPQLYVLKTVNVIVAGTGIIVLDKSNKKLWDATLTYPVNNSGAGFFSHEHSKYGEGPVVEHGSTLYVFDQAVLTSFDLNSGNARWRLPSVGIVGLFFDGKDNVYVNTTTGNPDDVRYSRQIDVTRDTQPVLTKVEPNKGTTLWSIKPAGFVSYLSGKFIYVIDCYDPNPTDEDQMNDMLVSMQKPAFLKITRIRPSDGKIMWDYYERGRCPVNWNFDDNSIQLIFKREVQVLRYVTL